MANTSTREAQERAKAKLAERRQREDELIETVTTALVTREEATEALAAAEAALSEAVGGLAELGIGRDELAAILEVPAEQLGGKAKGRPRKVAAAPPDAAAPPPEEPPAPEPAPAAAKAVAKAAPAGRARKARASARPDAGA
jgi:hypothetical protein